MQTLPLAFALDIVVTAPCFSFLLCETFKPQVEHSMVAGKRQEPSSILAGFTLPSSSPELPLGAAHTGGQLAGKLWVVGGIFPFWGCGVVLDQDYMDSFFRIDLHAFFLQLNPINRFERSVTSLAHVQT